MTPETGAAIVTTEKALDVRNTLNFQQRFAIANVVIPATEKLADGMCRYLDGATDASIAAKMSAELGVTVSEYSVKSIRAEVVGKLRTWAKGDPKNDNSAEIEELRTVIAHLSAKVENLRKVIEHHDTKAHDRRASCTATLRGVIGKNRADERTVRTQMRGAGFGDDEISMSLYLAGAIVRQNGAGTTVELPVGR